MRSSSPASGTTAPVSRIRESEARNGPARSSVGQDSGSRLQAVQAPIPEVVSAAENPGHAMADALSAQVAGRRTLSTAFVRVGPDGHLTVELHDGSVLVLRDVVMRTSDYCGKQVQGGPVGKRYCGKYANVAAARPGGAPVPDESVPAVSNLRSHF